MEIIIKKFNNIIFGYYLIDYQFNFLTINIYFNLFINDFFSQSLNVIILYHIISSNFDFLTQNFYFYKTLISLQLL